ncbi:MAG: hypothetical protein KKB20_08050 [Proteobacteria bacterium]|nr:hypothetical protein [Pseudomonadota bacterium]
MDFKAFDDWIEIFQGGRQIDSQGRAWDGNRLIDRAVSNFDPARHEPPLVVGHPENNAPAFGWVREVRQVDKAGVPILEARFGQVAPEFEAAVREGRYKKRSASFYPDGRLRHVGFLGAAPPAVKGLADVAFDECDSAVVFKFGEDVTGPAGSDNTTGDQNKRGGFLVEIREFFDGFKSFMGLAKEMQAAPAPASPETGKSFTEADVEAAKAAAADEARRKAETEFAEKAAKTARGVELRGQVDQLVKDGKLPPSIADMGLREFVCAIDDEAQIGFGEGEKKTQASPAEFVFQLLDRMNGLGLFKEIATRDASTGAAEFAEAQKDADLGRSIAAKTNPPAAG